MGKQWNGTPAKGPLWDSTNASKDGHSRRCWRRAAANLGGHTVLRQVWHGRDQAWRLRRERPMLATPHREQPTCRRTGSRLQNNRPLPHPVKTVAARPGSVLSMVDTESPQFAQWAPSRVLTAIANPPQPSEVERERGLLESTPADIVRVDADDLTQTMVHLQVVGDGERTCHFWGHVA